MWVSEATGPACWSAEGAGVVPAPVSPSDELHVSLCPRRQASVVRAWRGQPWLELQGPGVCWQAGQVWLVLQHLFGEATAPSGV